MKELEWKNKKNNLARDGAKQKKKRRPKGGKVIGIRKGFTQTKLEQGVIK